MLPLYTVDDLLALKSIPSPLLCVVLTVAIEIALFADVGELKQPVAVPIFSVRTLAKSQKRPVMFGASPNITGQAVFGAASNFARVSASIGAFSQGNPQQSFGNISAGDVQNTTLILKASDSNGIYNNSQLQPRALQLLACIRC